MHQTLALDRTLVVNQQQCVMTGWIPIDAVVLACKDKMGVGDVEKAYKRVLSNGIDCGSWPPPVGYWDDTKPGNRFYLTDGRHEYIARVMLGATHIFVAWVS